MSRVLVTLCLVATTLLAQPVSAVPVEASGRAVIAGSLNLARENAIQQALQQAALQAGVQVRSRQRLEMGEIREDSLQLNSSSRVRLQQIRYEGQVGDVYEVAITADVQPEAMCPGSEHSYRKVIAIAGFGLVDRQQAVIGKLDAIEQALPAELLRTLNREQKVQALDASQTRLFDDPMTAPSMANGQQRLTTSVALATRLGAQYVVSGVIRDLGTGDEKATGMPRRLQWRDWLGITDRPLRRRFGVELFVHDGLGGALLFQRYYQTSGFWNLPSQQVTGFATSDFWGTDYGQQVALQLQAMTEDLTEVLRCQPFMARIVSTRGNRLHIEAGAVSGMRPGDKLQVYRTGTFYNLDLEPRTELTDMATEVVIKQVQPQFVIAEMRTNAEALMIQRDDLVIAW